MAALPETSGLTPTTPTVPRLAPVMPWPTERVETTSPGESPDSKLIVDVCSTASCAGDPDGSQQQGHEQCQECDRDKAVAANCRIRHASLPSLSSVSVSTGAHPPETAIHLPPNVHDGIAMRTGSFPPHCTRTLTLQIAATASMGYDSRLAQTAQRGRHGLRFALIPSMCFYTHRTGRRSRMGAAADFAWPFWLGYDVRPLECMCARGNRAP